MKSFLTKRVKALEARDAVLPPSREAIEQGINRDLARAGLTREQAVAKYGSLPDFIYWLLNEETKVRLCEPDMRPSDGLTTYERYVRMLPKRGA